MDSTGSTTLEKPYISSILIRLIVHPRKLSGMDKSVSVTPATVVRHVIAIALLWLAWTRLSSWYTYEGWSDYGIFAICFLSAGLIAGWKQFRYLLKGTSRSRIVLAGFILFLALPWSEWFRRALPDARGAWSRQVFQQFCFLYSGMIFLSIFPAFRDYVKGKTSRGIEYLSLRFGFPILIPALFFCFSSWIVLFVYQKTPLVQDTAAYLFQAKIFLAGKLVAPEPPAPETFSGPGDMLVLRDGKWYSSYPPGFSLALALAMLVKFEWLFCPLLGAATVWIWIQYALRWHDRRVALVLGILCLFSPMMLLMYSNMMVHTAELFYSSMIIYLCRRETEGSSAVRLSLIGIILFLATITRGFSILPFLAPVLFYTLAKRVGAQFFRLAGVIGIGIFCGLIAIGVYQWKTTGSPWLSAFILQGSESPYFGFRGEFLGQKHSPLRGLENVSNNLIAMNSWIAGWPSGAIVFLLLLLARGKDIQAWDTCLLLGCFFLALFYFLYVMQDLVIGPRFWFSMLPIWLLFLARGILVEPSRVRAFSIPLAAMSFSIALIFVLPGYVKIYAPQDKEVGQLRKALTETGSMRAIVVLSPKVQQQYVNWNDPFLRDHLIICNRMGQDNAELQKAFPDYRMLYFRETSDARGMSVSTGYRLLPDPDLSPPGSFSMQQFTLLIESANDFRDHDVFDAAYVNLFAGSAATDQLAYLKQIDEALPTDQGYRNALKSSLVHLARAILLPKEAFEERRGLWSRGFNLEAFRLELDAAAWNAAHAGDVGKVIQDALSRVVRRIDRNGDGRLSTQETSAFLHKKLRVLETM